MKQKTKLTNSIFLATAFTLQMVPATWALDTQEVIKYFNPIHEKSYLNESQDRIIKKKSYKVAALKALKPIENREIGVFAIVETNKLTDFAYLEKLLKLPSVNGISCLFSWRQLEPAKENFDWQAIDQILSLCAKENKSLILRISTCGLNESIIQHDLGSSAIENSDTPHWVFDEGVKYVSYPAANGKQYIMPIFWDNTYIAHWSNFVNALGHRYDKNPFVQSVGITGGGFLSGTSMVPDFQNNKDACEQLTDTLKKDFGMNPRQIVQHWKYAADVFPRAFPNARLSFDIDPPTPNRAGQDELDEISDYLVYRYGQRIYLVRENVCDAKHGFDQYRVILKFKSDTLTGYQISADTAADCLGKLSKNIFDDGVSFAEVPASFFFSKEAAVTQFIDTLNEHLGYQIVAQSAKLPSSLKTGNNLSASFQFMNVGDHAPMRPVRELDKDVASSYRIQLELRDKTGKVVVASLHTPSTPTNSWLPGKPISWQQDLKLGKVKPGEYSVWLSIVDDANKRKLNILNALSDKEPSPQSELFVSILHITE